ncbi:hypothetical protein OK015_21045 [Mycobacterium sp. Aquia_216]|uniref:hypothetical protein n=1 Tax=Mycobacterium sp. Aquia_216 TaxID=2991729 RepID=UPI00227B0A8C|nr:hypothetical protein [Mycobacterium sp. Aquia_216]WAJ43657.1 hypothetical protein OK015_21045 [Mycobacterium sp. Aquia_216]
MALSFKTRRRVVARSADPSDVPVASALVTPDRRVSVGDRLPVFVLPFPPLDLAVAWCEADHNQLEA